MKHLLLVLSTLLILSSCKSDSKSEQQKTEETQVTNVTANTIKSAEKEATPTEDVKKEVVKEPIANNNSPEALAKKEVEQLFQLSGIPKEEYQGQLNNPDSLKQLLQLVEKNKKAAAPLPGIELKADVTIEQLTSKKSATGVSVEEAILTLQKELKGKSFLEKTSQIDSVSGTKIMSSLSEREARKVLHYVYGKETERLRQITLKTGFMHSAPEAKAYKKELETLLDNYEKGNIVASASYPTKIERSLGILNSVQRKIDNKSKEAQNDFKELNPDLYFGPEVGETFFGSNVKTAVYLPLGKLSFADTIIRAYHPKLNVHELKNVLGPPDAIEDEGSDKITGIYSLGKKGHLTVQFTDNALTNVNGPDLYIFEIGKIEPTNLEISKDGLTWIKVGKIDGGVCQVDIDAYVEPGDLFYYVRLTDLEQPSGLPGADVDAIAAIGAAMRLKLDSKVLFETGKSVLKPEGIEALKELSESISILKKGKVIVEGHTDDVGKESYNQKLSLDRSKSVVVELKKLIPSNSFDWMERGMGETVPIVDNDSDENRAKNRRVEILVVPN